MILGTDWIMICCGRCDTTLHSAVSSHSVQLTCVTVCQKSEYCGWCGQSLSLLHDNILSLSQPPSHTNSSQFAASVSDVHPRWQQVTSDDHNLDATSLF